MLIPFFDRLHATMLFWLSPSQQIRPPIYSLRQRSQRRKIVVKYSIVYFLIQAVFVALIVVPVVPRRPPVSSPRLCP
jgi:1,3-beta-glucan synthase